MQCQLSAWKGWLLILWLKQCCSLLILKYVGMDLQHLGEICPGSVGGMQTSVQSSEICGNCTGECLPCEWEFRSFPHKDNFQQWEGSLLITPWSLQQLLSKHWDGKSLIKRLPRLGWNVSVDQFPIQYIMKYGFWRDLKVFNLPNLIISPVNQLSHFF